ncbi:hypothetical protein BD410DRAFT_795587 [Rickenella mellea]|uniref:Uncharacterized protein n=1 Tax=Rickenella mellea TaxID=50990 RepID=A0A4Y7PLA8_9AGAM|nr:hypothetical protein BD410DRAFT_795587 [Rickenella mellea]
MTLAGIPSPLKPAPITLATRKVTSALRMPRPPRTRTNSIPTSIPTPTPSAPRAASVPTPTPTPVPRFGARHRRAHDAIDDTRDVHLALRAQRVRQPTLFPGWRPHLFMEQAPRPAPSWPEESWWGFVQHSLVSYLPHPPTTSRTTRMLLFLLMLLRTPKIQEPEIVFTSQQHRARRRRSLVHHPLQFASLSAFVHHGPAY